MGVEKWVNFWGGKVGRFWKLALIFFNSKVINMLYLFTSLSKLQSRKGAENKHNYDECGGFDVIKCQILKTNGRENLQQLVKKITC